MASGNQKVFISDIFDALSKEHQMTHSLLDRFYQICAIAMLALACSLVWRTGIQPVLVYSSSVQESLLVACKKEDGCRGLYEPESRYASRLGTWIPVVEVALVKGGKHNTKLIEQKIRSEMLAVAEGGMPFLREARKNMEIKFK